MNWAMSAAVSSASTWLASAGLVAALPTPGDLEGCSEIERRGTRLLELPDDVVPLAALEPAPGIAFQRGQDLAAIHGPKRLDLQEGFRRKALPQGSVDGAVGLVRLVIEHGNNELQRRRQLVGKPAETIGLAQLIERIEEDDDRLGDGRQQRLDLVAELVGILLELSGLLDECHGPPRSSTREMSSERKSDDAALAPMKR